MGCGRRLSRYLLPQTQHRNCLPERAALPPSQALNLQRGLPGAVCRPSRARGKHFQSRRHLGSADARTSRAEARRSRKSRRVRQSSSVTANAHRSARLVPGRCGSGRGVDAVRQGGTDRARPSLRQARSTASSATRRNRVRPAPDAERGRRTGRRLRRNLPLPRPPDRHARRRRPGYVRQSQTGQVAAKRGQGGDFRPGRVGRSVAPGNRRDAAGPAAVFFGTASSSAGGSSCGKTSASFTARQRRAGDGDRLDERAASVPASEAQSRCRRRE